MDTIISTQVAKRKRRRYFWIISIVLLIIAFAVVSLRSVIKSSVQRSEIITSVAEVGPIENTINASGQIVPEFEEVIASPVNASIEKVLLDVGTQVKEGQSILLLDKSASQVQFEKLKFEVESKHNVISKLKLDLDKSFSDLKSNNDIKQLKINSLEANLEDAKRLYKAGGGTQEDIKQAELNLKVAKLEKEQLESEIKSKQQTMKIEMKESEIAAAIQENDLKELQRKLELANIIAKRPGVITWVNKNIGATIHEGDILARIADLESFKISGTISDNYLDQIHAGMPCIIHINDSAIRGKITTINPAVQNGLISFDIQPDVKSNRLFRPNMKVDVFVVTDQRNNVIRVSNGPAFKGSVVQDVFVIKGDKAEKRTVHIGMTNFDYIEIKDNLKPGEAVITTDLPDFKNVKEITIK